MNNCSFSSTNLPSGAYFSETQNRFKTRKTLQVYEECEMPALGTALAQFSFDGGTEGTMKIGEGEELLLIERDEGDGWTRVRK